MVWESLSTYFPFPIQLQKKLAQFLETQTAFFLWGEGEQGFIGCPFNQAKQEAGREHFCGGLKSLEKQIQVLHFTFVQLYPSSVMLEYTCLSLGHPLNGEQKLGTKKNPEALQRNGLGKTWNLLDLRLWLSCLPPDTLFSTLHAQVSEFFTPGKDRLVALISWR